MGGGVYASCDEEHAELVVGGVAVASGGASVPFDDSVAGSGCVEVGQECVLPLALGPAQASNFGDGTRW